MSNRTYQKAIKAFGEADVIYKVIEELSELLVAIIHYRDGKISLPKLIDEMADVKITTEKLEVYLTDKLSLDIVGFISDAKKIKLQGLEKLIKKKNEGRGRNGRSKNT